MDEQNRARTILYRQLMEVPHREYDGMVCALRGAMQDDPDFIARASAYIVQNSAIRDQQDAAVIALLQADPEFSEYRDAGEILLLGSNIIPSEPNGLRGLPPYRIFRVAQYISQSNHKVPRRMKHLMRRYLAALEANNRRWDNVALLNRKALKWAYKHSRTRPSERADSALFKDNPTPDSLLWAVKAVKAAGTLQDKARLVVEHRIPYTVASSLLPKTPEASVALIDVMTPTQAVNSRAWVEESGILRIKEVKTAYLAKVEQATESVARVEGRKSARGVDEDVEAATQKAKEKAVKKQREQLPIERDFLLLVDRSSSMHNAVSTAVHFGARIAPLCTGNIYVVAFNDYAQVIEVRDQTSYAGWQKAFKGIRDSGSTSMQAGLDKAIENGFDPGLIAIVTDGGENRGSFSQRLRRMVDEGLISNEPSVAVIGLDTERLVDDFANRIEQQNFHVDRFFVRGEDYNIFDQVAMMLGGKRGKSLVELILDAPLPRKVKNNG